MILAQLEDSRVSLLGSAAFGLLPSLCAAFRPGVAVWQWLPLAGLSCLVLAAIPFTQANESIEGWRLRAAMATVAYGAILAAFISPL